MTAKTTFQVTYTHESPNFLGFAEGHIKGNDLANIWWRDKPILAALKTLWSDKAQITDVQLDYLGTVNLQSDSDPITNEQHRALFGKWHEAAGPLKADDLMRHRFTEKILGREVSWSPRNSQGYCGKASDAMTYADFKRLMSAMDAVIELTSKP